MDKRKTFYNTRTWVNDDDSPSTGSIVCYDGMYTDDDKPFRNLFVEVSSCHEKARLHKMWNEHPDLFYNKIKMMRDALTDFMRHLYCPYQEAYQLDGTKIKVKPSGMDDNMYIDEDGKEYNKSYLSFNGEVTDDVFTAPTPGWVKDAASDICKKFNISDAIDKAYVSSVICQHYKK